MTKVKNWILKKLFRFRAENFYKLLNQQKGKCYLTGRELYPVDALVEHIVPLRKGGEHEFKNTCLIISPLSKLKRYYTEEEIVHISADIIKNKGNQYGYRIGRQPGRRK
ncbi:HNH endonuclease [Leptospira borgpetersenii]|uniref:HNH endonuclease n=1 Tax=Leptospira borgpetersenii TaxID=174 RepID=UPI00077357C7|nr:hypothetical protein [Leptospira borgpetersenii]